MKQNTLYIDARITSTDQRGVNFRSHLKQNTLYISLAMLTTGFASLLYEVILISTITAVVGMTETSTSLVLATFITGLALGALIGGRIAKSSPNALAVFIIIEILVALFGFTAMTVFTALLAYRGFFFLYPLLFLLLLIPSTLMGMEIPLAVQIVNISTAEVGRDTGAVYFADTLGGGIGALTTGLFFIPNLGYHGAMAFGGILNLGTALLAYRLRAKNSLPTILAVTLIVGGTIALFGSSETLHGLQLRFFQQNYDAVPIYSEITPYQHIMIVPKGPYGRGLVLNGDQQITEKDSLEYHEYLVLPALAVNPNASTALVIGGGDGGALRQLVERNVSRIDHVDIDKRVVEIAREYLWNVHRGAIDDPRVRRIIDDGRKYLMTTNETYDLIIIDLPDPTLLPLAPLYTKEFYRAAVQRLSPQGILAVQSASPYYHTEGFASIYRTITSVAKYTGAFAVASSSFSSLGYVLASNDNDVTVAKANLVGEWYDSKDHAALFVLPRRITNALANASIQISTDVNPAVYRYHQPEYQAKGVLDN